MLEFNVFKYYFEHNDYCVHFFVMTTCMLTKTGFHVLMTVEASQNSGYKYLTIINSKPLVEI
jgi:hypothetical protein